MEATIMIVLLVIVIPATVLLVSAGLIFWSLEEKQHKE